LTFFLLQNAPSCEWLGNHNWSFKTGTNKLTFVFQNAPSCEWLGRDNETYIVFGNKNKTLSIKILISHAYNLGIFVLILQRVFEKSLKLDLPVHLMVMDYLCHK
jgi:hypothetical protein